jgi:hypothetical protein
MILRTFRLFLFNIELHSNVGINMEKFDITKAYAARADALAGKIPEQPAPESKSKNENHKRKKK